MKKTKTKTKPNPKTFYRFCAVALVSVLTIFTALTSCTSDVDDPDAPDESGRLILVNFPPTASEGASVRGQWLVIEASFENGARRLIGVAAGAAYDPAAIAPVRIPNDAGELHLDIYEVNPTTGASLGRFTGTQTISMYMTVLSSGSALPFASYITRRSMDDGVHNHPYIPFINGSARHEADDSPGFHQH